MYIYIHITYIKFAKIYETTSKMHGNMCLQLPHIALISNMIEGVGHGSAEFQ